MDRWSRSHRCGDQLMIQKLLLLFAIFRTVSALPSSAVETWYRGCYNVSNIVSSLLDGNYVAIENYSSPVDCGLTCYSNGYQYIALNPFDGCLCLATFVESDVWLRLPADFCNISCVLVKDDATANQSISRQRIALPCGGFNVTSVETATSVYLSAGPVLNNLTVSLWQPVIYAGQTVDIVVTAFYIASSVTPLGVPLEPGLLDSAAQVLFRWQRSDGIFEKTVATADTYIVQSVISMTFNTDGLFTIDVIASNIISSVRTSIDVNVALPIPCNLTVTLLSGIDNLPSCHPAVSNSTSNFADEEHVFRNSPVQFEAFTAVNANVTFVWTVTDVDAKATIEIVSVAGSRCYHGQSCTTSLQSFTFPNVGRYSIRVSVSNDFGSAEYTVPLVASDRGVTRVTLQPQTLLTTTDSSLRFLITIATTTFTNASLTVEFGDGSPALSHQLAKQPAELNGNDDISIGNDDGSSGTSFFDSADESKDNIVLFYDNYGLSCELNAVVTHPYSVEGFYEPSVIIDDGLRKMSTRLASEAYLTVQQRMVDVMLNASELIASTGSNVTIEATTIPRSEYATYVWTVFYNNVALRIPENMTRVSVLHQRFDRAGTYLLNVSAENAVSHVTRSVNVTVVDPVFDLVLFCGDSSCIKTTDVVECTASVAGGGDVAFEWNIAGVRPKVVRLGDHSSKAFGTTELSHVGHYLVTVTASNLYNTLSAELELSVSEVIYHLSTSVVHPVLPRQIFNLTACCIFGSDVEFVFDFAEDKQSVLSAGSDADVSHVYSQPGMHVVNIVARNNVSNSSLTIEIDVRPNISAVQLQVISVPVVNRSTVFIADIDEHNDTIVLYVWSVNNTLLSTTFQRSFVWTFQSVGYYNICVDAQNLVSHASDCLVTMVTTEPDNRTLFDNAVVFSFPQVSLMWQNILSVGHEANVSYGDGTVETVTVGHRTRLEHSYSEPGLYELRAWSVESLETVMTFVSVQIPLENLQLSGPTFIPVSSLCNSSQFVALLSNGTDVVYTWSIDSLLVLTTASNKFTTALSHGDHTVHVTAVNGIGNLTTSLNVSVQHHISIQNSHIVPVILGIPSEIVIVLSGDREFIIDVDFGDGMAMSDLRTNASSSFITLIAPKLFGLSHFEAPSYRLILNHSYTTLGDFSVVVTVSNNVSLVKVLSTASVGELLSDVTMATDAMSPLATNSVISVTASVTSGCSVMFNWTCNLCTAEPQINSNNCNRSTALFHLSLAGIYHIEVMVSNRFSDVVRNGSVSLRAVDQVTGLRMSALPAAGKLTEDGNGTWTTKPIAFTTSVDRGTDVTFALDFGDETDAVLPGVTEMSLITAVAHHIYNKEGAYQVTATASDIIGNLSTSLLFHVQKPVIGLSLNSTSVYARLGTNVTFHAHIVGGSSVLCNWDFGDMELYTDHGALVTHRYLSLGTFIAVVYAHNRVSSLNASCNVIVQDLIQSIELQVDTDIQKVNSSILFTAVMHPNIRNNVNYFQFSFGDGAERKVFGYSERHSYRKTGIYFATVTAVNNLGSKMSEKVVIQIIDELDDVKIYLNDQQDTDSKWTLVNSECEFRGYHYRGTNVTFDWDFGDGRRLTVAKSATVKHTFTALGQVTVKVVASNPVSNRTSSAVVFVLNDVCKPPVIKLFPSSDNATLLRSAELRIEADIQMNCSLTLSTLYRWSLYNSTTAELIDLGSLNLTQYIYHDPLLLLPPKSLPYGSYTVELLVEMNGTIVYGSAQTSFSIVPSPLMSIIDGGFQRFINRNMTNITVDGSKSYDPDFTASENILYSWTCFELTSSDKPCFIGQLSSDSPIRSLDPHRLSFSGSQLMPDATDFMFNLTVWVPGRGRSTTTQLLTISKAGIDENLGLIDVLIHCPQCNKVTINSNTQLVLLAVHSGYNNTELNYTWELFIVGGRSPVSYDDSSCVQADGTSWSMMLNQTDNSSLVVDATTTTSSTTTVSSSSSSSTPVMPAARAARLLSDNERTSIVMPADTFPSSTPTHHVVTRPSHQVVNSPRPTSAAGVPAGFLNPDEGGSSSVGRGGGRRSAAAGLPIPFEEGSVAANGRQPIILPPTDAPSRPSSLPVSDAVGILPDFPIAEGMGGDGRSSGRGWPSASVVEPSNRVAPGNPKPPNVDAAIDGSTFVRAPLFVAQLPRFPLTLNPTDTATGVASQTLVIKHNVLTRGNAYIVQLSVRHKLNSTVTGKVLIYFDVNQSPNYGRCTLKPDTGGIEMKTWFNLYCMEWRDDDLPIKYEVSFSRSAVERATLVYRGFMNSISFLLPAGLPAFNNTVQVHISIVDRLDAATLVCSITVPVAPSAMDEHDLSILVGSNNATGAMLPVRTNLELGYNNAVRYFSVLIASHLNRFSSVYQSDLRVEARRSLLSCLLQVPVRSTYEVQQMLSAIVAISAEPSELDNVSCQYAATVLSRTVQSAGYLLTTLYPYFDLYELLLFGFNGTSNVLQAVQEIMADGGVSQNKMEMKPVLISLMSTIEQLMQLQLRLMFIGEPLMNLSDDSLSLYVARYPLMQNFIQSGSVNVSLPSDALAKAATVNRLTVGADALSAMDFNCIYSAADCYEAALLLNKQNPFSYGLQEASAIETEIATLDLYSCDGQPLVIRNLTDQFVDISFPHLTAVQAVNDLVLDRNNMNIHMFNVSPSLLLAGPLHIDITINYSEPQLRPFPVEVKLRVNEPPTIDLYQQLWLIRPRTRNISVTVDPSILSVSKVFYLGLVDASYNMGRKRLNEVSGCTYSLHVWSGECVYWNEQTDSWLTDGCQLHNTSTFFTAHCRCNHLTSFAVKYSQLPNVLSTAEIASFFLPTTNAIVPALIASLLVIYAVIIVIVLKLDHHDERKSDIVRLVDNSPFDRQKYYISLETGFRKGAGTTAKVSLVLHGEYGMSETRELVSQSGQPLFERNSRDTFFMTFPESLGRIFKVQLWHNNGGSSPSWYLSRVVVRDACTGEVYYFVFEKWFAVEKEDGKVEREVMAADRGLGFIKVLQAKSTQYLTDYHLWFSAFVKPSYSRFTRAQRTTCCLCLLMAYMVLEAVWFHYNFEEYRGEFALIDVSWMSISVGIVSGLACLPLNFFICSLFRRSVVRRNGFHEQPDNVQPSVDSKPVAASSTNNGTTENSADITESSMFYQSVMTWKNLQEWAQRAWAKRYQQSPIGSTQNVKPIIVQGDADAIINPPAIISTGVTESGDQFSDVLMLHGAAVASPGSANVQQSAGLGGPRETSNQRRTVAADVPSRQHEAVAAGLPARHVDPLTAVVETVEQRNSLAVCECCLNAANNQLMAPTDTSGRRLSAASKKGKKSRSNTSSEGSSPATSFSENSPKPPRRAGPSEHSHGSECLSSVPSSVPSSVLPPPSYGVFQHSSTLPLKSNSEPFPPSSNRSSVKSSRSAHSDDGSSSFRSLKADRCFLPHPVLYFAWALCIFIIAGCGASTIYIGVGFSSSRGILWLQSWFFSALQSFFITQPLIVVFMTIYTAVRYRNDMSIFDHHNDGIVRYDIDGSSGVATKSFSLEPNKDFSVAQGMAARQRSRYLRFARPPQEQRLIEARNLTMKETNATALVNESLLFVIQFLLLIFITFGKGPDATCRLNLSLRHLLARGGETPFDNITSVDKWWTWVQGPFLSTMSEDNSDIISGVANCLLVGKMNIRQLRVRPQPCNLPPSILPKSLCFALYDSADHDNATFGKHQTYWYCDAEQTGSGSFQGDFGLYGGDGYVVSFSSGSNRLDVIEELKSLQNEKWINAYTSAVIVEFTLFHTQSTLFSSVMLALELPPLGMTRTKHHIVSVYLYKYTSTMDRVILCCELLFFIATLVKVHHETLKVLRVGIRYVKNIWNIIEVSQCLLSLTLLFGLVYRFLLITSTIEKLRSTYFEEFVDVSQVEYWDMTMQTVASFVLLFVGLHLLKSLRHHRPFAVFSNIYEHASVDVIVFAWMFIIWLGAYTSLGMALFGGMMPEFASIGSATGFLASVTTRSFDFSEKVESLDTAVNIGWRVFAAVFVITALGSLAAYMKAALNFYYKVFKEEPVLVFSSRENIRYYYNRLRELLHLSSPPHSKEPENPLPPEFTMAEIQYQVDEMLFKMSALAGVSNLPEKPSMYFTDSDTTCGGAFVGGEDAVSSGGSEVRAFDEDKFENRMQKLKDNLLIHDPHLAQLLHSDSMCGNVMEHETEKQLMMQLELEIFRQLQMKRRDNRPSDSSDVYATSGLSSNPASQISSKIVSSSGSGPTSTVSNHDDHLLSVETREAVAFGVGMTAVCSPSPAMLVPCGNVVQDARSPVLASSSEVPVPLTQLEMLSQPRSHVRRRQRPKSSTNDANVSGLTVTEISDQNESTSGCPADVENTLAAHAVTVLTNVRPLKRVSLEPTEIHLDNLNDTLSTVEAGSSETNERISHV